MQNNLTLTFQSFIQKLHENKFYLQALKNSVVIYKINSFRISNLTPNMIKTTIANFKNSKNKQKNINSLDNSQMQVKKYDDQHWKINELKSFVWIIVCYSYLTKRHISQFQQIDWSFIRSVFSQKSPQNIEYQANILIRTSQKKNRLTQEESQLFSIIFNESKTQGKWNQISKTLYLRSNKKLLLTPHKCREHWFNHLNAKIVHGQWSLEQDLKIFQQIQKIGFKWSKIAKLMGGTRTQHMVKNRFNSLISKWRIKHLAQPLQRITKRIIIKIKHQLIKKKHHISQQSLICQQSKHTIEIEQEQDVKTDPKFFSRQTATDIQQLIDQSQLMSFTGINQKLNECQMIQIDESFQNCFASRSLLEDFDQTQKEPFQGYIKFW